VRKAPTHRAVLNLDYAVSFKGVYARGDTGCTFGAIAILVLLPWGGSQVYRSASSMQSMPPPAACSRQWMHHLGATGLPRQLSGTGTSGGPFPRGGLSGWQGESGAKKGTAHQRTGTLHASCWFISHPAQLYVKAGWISAAPHVMGGLALKRGQLEPESTRCSGEDVYTASLPGADSPEPCTGASGRRDV
jgi:hypothetical protein